MLVSRMRQQCVLCRSMTVVDWGVSLTLYDRRFGGHGRRSERMERTGWTADRRRLLPAPRGNRSVSSHSGRTKTIDRTI